MRAFITGGTGFLGTHLVQELDKAGWEIHALHRSENGLETLRRCRNVVFCKGDILDVESIRRGMPQGVDAVFHVAGSVENLAHSQEHSRFAINQLGTRNMIDVALEKGIGRFVHTSTVLTYDFRAGPRVTEAYPRNMWTQDPYMKSKRLADEEVDKGKAAKLDVVYMHPSAVFGAHDKATWSKMFREVKRGILAAPPGALSACHAGAVAKAHVAAYSLAPPGAHYLLGGPDVSLLDIAKEISRITGFKGPTWALPAPLFKAYGWAEFLLSTYVLKREPMLTPHTLNLLTETVLCDSTKAIRELGYESPSLNFMLEECYAWMKQVGMI